LKALSIACVDKRVAINEGSYATMVALSMRVATYWSGVIFAVAGCRPGKLTPRTRAGNASETTLQASIASIAGLGLGRSSNAIQSQLPIVV